MQMQSRRSNVPTHDLQGIIQNGDDIPNSTFNVDVQLGSMPQLDYNRNIVNCVFGNLCRFRHNRQAQDLEKSLGIVGSARAQFTIFAVEERKEVALSLHVRSTFQLKTE